MIVQTFTFNPFQTNCYVCHDEGEAVVVDPSSASPREHRAVARAYAFLRAEQEPDGSWFGRWGVNHVYGTGAVLPALAALGEDMTQPHVQRAVAWLLEHPLAFQLVLAVLVIALIGVGFWWGQRRHGIDPDEVPGTLYVGADDGSVTELNCVPRPDIPGTLTELTDYQRTRPLAAGAGDGGASGRAANAYGKKSCYGSASMTPLRSSRICARVTRCGRFRAKAWRRRGVTC